MSTTWTCHHGMAATQRGECGACNDEIAGRPAAESMTGDERAAEVRALLDEPSGYRMDDLHKRIEELT